MQKTVKIQYREREKYFTVLSGAFVLKEGDKVIVQKQDKSLDFATVMCSPRYNKKTTINQNIDKIFRIATEQDILIKKQNEEKEKKAFDLCVTQKEKLKLDMQLFAVESSFNSSKLTFLFTANDRVDFRELIKILVKELKTKIELRQVGIRNFVKLYGSIGICGRKTCCSTFIKKFSSISLRMAKNQNMSLNPGKISGICNRLLCCLEFENDTYTEMRKNMPPIGTKVQTHEGSGIVTQHFVIQEKVEVNMRIKDNDNKSEIQKNVIVDIKDLI